MTLVNGTVPAGYENSDWCSNAIYFAVFIPGVISSAIGAVLAVLLMYSLPTGDWRWAGKGRLQGVCCNTKAPAVSTGTNSEAQLP